MTVLALGQVSVHSIKKTSCRVAGQITLINNAFLCLDIFLLLVKAPLQGAQNRQILFWQFFSRMM